MRALVRWGCFAIAIALVAALVHFVRVWRSCDDDFIEVNAPPDVGAANWTPFSLRGCTVEYLLVSGDAVVVPPPFDFWPFITGVLVAGIVLVVLGRTGRGNSAQGN